MWDWQRGSDYIGREEASPDESVKVKIVILKIIETKAT